MTPEDLCRAVVGWIQNNGYYVHTYLNRLNGLAITNYIELTQSPGSISFKLLDVDKAMTEYSFLKYLNSLHKNWAFHFTVTGSEIQYKIQYKNKLNIILLTVKHKFCSSIIHNQLFKMYICHLQVGLGILSGDKIYFYL